MDIVSLVKEYVDGKDVLDIGSANEGAYDLNLPSLYLRIKPFCKSLVGTGLLKTKDPTHTSCRYAICRSEEEI